MGDAVDFGLRLRNEVDSKGVSILTDPNGILPLHVRREDKLDGEGGVLEELIRYVRNQYGRSASSRLQVSSLPSAKEANDDFDVNIKCTLGRREPCFTGPGGPEGIAVDGLEKYITVEELENFLHRFLFLTRYRFWVLSWGRREDDGNIIIPAGTEVSINDRVCSYGADLSNFCLRISDEEDFFRGLDEGEFKPLEGISFTLDQEMSLAKFHETLPFLLLNAGYPKIVAMAMYAGINGLEVHDDRVFAAFGITPRME